MEPETTAFAQETPRAGRGQRGILVIWLTTVITALVFGVGGYMLGQRSVSVNNPTSYELEDIDYAELDTVDPVVTESYAKQVLSEIMSLDSSIPWKESAGVYYFPLSDPAVQKPGQQITARISDKSKFTTITGYLQSNGWVENGGGEATYISVANWKKYANGKDQHLVFRVDNGLVTIFVFD